MVNEFKNTQMKEALAKIKEKQTTETINTMLAALMTTKFLAPATWDKEPTMNDKGQMIFEPNTKFQLMIIETNQKDCYFPMFTDMEELRKWNFDPKIRSLVLTFEQFMPFIELAKNDIKGIVFDPFGANLPITNEFLFKLHEQQKTSLQENQIKKGDKIYMREPVENIDDLKAAVCEYAKNDPNILSVYIKERVDKEKPSHWFMIVETANEDVEVFKQIGQACRSVNHGKEIEFMFASASLAKNVMANTKPIYVKENN